jgi:hypothetical protein
MPGKEALHLYLLDWADEIRDPRQQLGGVLPEQTAGTQQELDTAVQLIEAMAIDFDPRDYSYTFQQRVRALIEAKRADTTIEKAAVTALNRRRRPHGRPASQRRGGQGRPNVTQVTRAPRKTISPDGGQGRATNGQRSTPVTSSMLWPDEIRKPELTLLSEVGQVDAAPHEQRDGPDAGRRPVG